MAVVTFEQPDGRRDTIEAEEGQTLMEAALYNGIEGIQADCGGELACATCQVIIAPEWRDVVPQAQGDELDMLDFAVAKEVGLRLSCQITLEPALDGLTVRVPVSQQ